MKCPPLYLDIKFLSLSSVFRGAGRKSWINLICGLHCFAYRRGVYLPILDAIFSFWRLKDTGEFWMKLRYFTTLWSHHSCIYAKFYFNVKTSKFRNCAHVLLMAYYNYMRRALATDAHLFNKLQLKVRIEWTPHDFFYCLFQSTNPSWNTQWLHGNLCIKIWQKVRSRVNLYWKSSCK